jgi:hypothetical protein
MGAELGCSTNCFKEKRFNALFVSRFSPEVAADAAGNSLKE